MPDSKRRVVQFVFVSVLVGLLLSQYAPLFGTAAQRAAEPWTPLRKTLAGNHMLLFAAAGLVSGFLFRRWEESREEP